MAINLTTPITELDFSVRALNLLASILNKMPSKVTFYDVIVNRDEIFESKMISSRTKTEIDEMIDEFYKQQQNIT